MEGKPIFRNKLSSLVVRIFDVARPWGPEKDEPDLIVLPQPMPPMARDDAVTSNDRTRSIFLN